MGTSTKLTKEEKATLQKVIEYGKQKLNQMRISGGLCGNVQETEDYSELILQAGKLEIKMFGDERIEIGIYHVIDNSAHCAMVAKYMGAPIPKGGWKHGRD